jgi:tetratricopeptide (TPR) repeat protein
MRRWLSAVFAGWVVSLGGAPVAAAHEIRLDDVQMALELTTWQLEQLGHGQGHLVLDGAEVSRRFQESLTLHLLGDHAAAAEGFYALEPLVADPSLRHDIQWYRATTLRQAQLPRLASLAFDAILGQPEHPYRNDALREALRLAAEQRDPERVVHLADLAHDAGDSLPPSLGYTLGRAWVQLGEPERAIRALVDIPDEAPDRDRASYVLGTAYVAAGRLDEAAGWFEQAAQTGRSEVALHARLALARLAHHRGDLHHAALAYATVPHDAPQFADALRELAWVYIADGDRLQAVQTIDYFLDAFPDHPEAGPMGIARGHLLLAEGELGAAEEAYLLAESRWGLATPQVLPPWAQQRVDRDPTVVRAVAAAGELQQVREGLAEARADAAELLSVDPVPLLRRRHRVTSLRLLRAVGEGLWRAADAELSARSAPASVRAMKDTHDALRARLEMLPPLDSDEAGPALHTLLDELEAHRAQVRAAAADRHHDVAIDRLSGMVARLHEAADVARQRLRHLDDRTLQPFHADLRQVADDLAADAVTITDLGERTDATARQVHGRALARTQAVVDAQAEASMAGLADVAWAQLVTGSDDRDELLTDRDAQLHALKATFDAARAR